MSQFGMESIKFSITITESVFSFLAYFFFYYLDVDLFKNEVRSANDVCMELGGNSQIFLTSGDSPV